jgi:hypothetical protein
MMKTPLETKPQEQDPLGLRDLPMLTPDEDGWPAIERALLVHRQTLRRRRVAGGWLAAAASVVLVIGLAVRQPGPAPAESTQPPAGSSTGQAATASAGDGETVDSLIAMSQMLERQLRDLREESGPLPAESVVYLAELEDLVAQVDNELSYTPDSVNLWSQRVNLLLDLAQLYQHQWERQYGRMASL